MEGQLFGEGDHVVYFGSSENNPTSGVIKQILQESSSDTDVPRYVIENDKSHKEATYKLENIIEKVREGGYGEEMEESTGFEEDVGEIYEYEEEEEEEEEISGRSS